MAFLASCGNKADGFSSNVSSNESADISTSQVSVTTKTDDVAKNEINIELSNDELVLSKNGKIIETLPTYINLADEQFNLSKVLQVLFFDYTADDITDIAVLGESIHGEYVLLYNGMLLENESGIKEDTFGYFGNLSKAQLNEMGCDITEDGIKRALLGDNTECIYNSYRELYTQLARAYHISNSEYMYDLIYADEDEIPELVINKLGYYVYLFTYENSKARCLMDKWGYGAMGNHGYSYFPGTGIYYNNNADYAGAIYTESYMSKHENGEIQTDYWVQTNYFQDIDEDGMPSYEELNTTFGDVGKIEYHCVFDENMSEDDIKKIVDNYNKQELVELGGKYEYETIMLQLQ
ncbi:hypothetical protein [Butyrivibrio sp. AE2015]|uniref:hypothetical protein n=1 Tax=Butyrivibrio sp. AE2015 TaxID=1280663 RepID=UPI0012DE6A42|nr:hypothetical protein [Butyrivibrio sp. AE2015]